MNNPIIGFARTLYLFLCNRIRFDKSVNNHELVMPDGKSFTIFRRVSIIDSAVKHDPEAYFLVRFKPKNIGIKENIRFSYIPMMIFMGFKGFRSKYWAVNYETGLCQGLYEWQTVEDARNYSKSIAMKFMIQRSDPGYIEYRIIDKKKELLEYKINSMRNEPGILEIFLTFIFGVLFGKHLR